MAKTTRVGKSLISIQEELGTEEQCLAFLETLRWPHGVRCLKCGKDKISKFTTKESERKSPYISKKTGQATKHLIPSRQLYQCLNHECGYQFTATTGTIFNDSHLELRKWMLAVAIMCNAKKGVSAKQLQRDIEVSYKTAWYLSHRIREAMAVGNFNDQKLDSVLEIDETFVGGKAPKGSPKYFSKTPVVGIRQRGGDLRFFKAEDVTSGTLAKFIEENVSPNVEKVMTDEWTAYPKAMIEAGIHGSKHHTIRHKSQVYAIGDVYTNSVESAFSLLKRGIIGSFHKISIKHLDRYLQEFSFRFNNRNNQELFALTVAALVLGIPLPYAKLIAESSSPSA
ncbi:MAG: IS1595 family transposase [Bryobacteraceae bacterium]